MALAKKPSQAEQARPPPNAPAEQGNGGARSGPGARQGHRTKAYRDMLLIRRFEEKAGQMYGMGLIGGFCHLYIGQEAVVVGMQIVSSTATRSSPRTVTMAICWRAAWTPRA